MSKRYRKRDAGLKLDDYAKTLEEIAQEMGVTKERVRQIETSALAKARMILQKHGFTLQDLLSDEARNDAFLQDLVPEGECHD